MADQVDLSDGTYIHPVEGWAVWIREQQQGLSRWHGTEGYERFREVLEMKLTDLMVANVEGTHDEAEAAKIRARAETLWDVITLLAGATQLEERSVEMHRIASRRHADARRREFVASHPDPAYAAGNM